MMAVFVALFVLLCSTTLSLQQGCTGRVANPKKNLLCYYSGIVDNFTLDPCICTHLVLTGFSLDDNWNLHNDRFENLTFVDTLKESNRKLSVLISIRMDTNLDEHSAIFSNISDDAENFGEKCKSFLQDNSLDGVELDWVLNNSTTSSLQHIRILEALSDTLKNNTNSSLILTSALPNKAADIIANYDVGNISKQVDLIFVPAYGFHPTESNETFHPSRLMGVSDMQNADSLLDLVLSLGAVSEKIVLGVPTFGIKYTLEHSNMTGIGAPTAGGFHVVPYHKICQQVKVGNWKVDRDDDLTSPRAFRDDEWIGYDDDVSIRTKGKYALLRDLAGVGLWSIDDDDVMGLCGGLKSPLANAARDTLDLFQDAGQNVVMSSMTMDLETSGSENIEKSVATLESVKRSTRSPSFRITQIVDRLGRINAIFDNSQTELQCTRAGYYRHPADCGRFYRCVKFDQRKDEFTVFEYDCPSGLVFDEKWEVCVWPSASIPCYGSSEIFPIPRNKFICPSVGYHRDPENCRWFYKCSDYSANGYLTAFEFRCPYGLVFDEVNLLCNWPWLAAPCGGNYGRYGGEVGTGFGYTGDVTYTRRSNPYAIESQGNYGVMRNAEDFQTGYGQSTLGTAYGDDGYDYNNQEAAYQGSHQGSGGYPSSTLPTYLEGGEGKTKQHAVGRVRSGGRSGGRRGRKRLKVSRRKGYNRNSSGLHVERGGSDTGHGGESGTLEFGRRLNVKKTIAGQYSGQAYDGDQGYEQERNNQQSNVNSGSYSSGDQYADDHQGQDSYPGSGGYGSKISSGNGALRSDIAWPTVPYDGNQETSGGHGTSSGYGNANADVDGTQQNSGYSSGQYSSGQTQGSDGYGSGYNNDGQLNYQDTQQGSQQSADYGSQKGGYKSQGYGSAAGQQDGYDGGYGGRQYASSTPSSYPDRSTSPTPPITSGSAGYSSGYQQSSVPVGQDYRHGEDYIGNTQSTTPHTGYDDDYPARSTLKSAYGAGFVPSSYSDGNGDNYNGGRTQQQANAGYGHGGGYASSTTAASRNEDGNYGQAYPSSTPKPVGNYGQGYQSPSPSAGNADGSYGQGYPTSQGNAGGADGSYGQAYPSSTPKPIGNYGQAYPSSTQKPVGNYGQGYQSPSPSAGNADGSYGQDYLPSQGNGGGADGNYGQAYPSSTPKPVGNYGQGYQSPSPSAGNADDSYGQDYPSSRGNAGSADGSYGQAYPSSTSKPIRNYGKSYQSTAPSTGYASGSYGQGYPSSTPNPIGNYGQGYPSSTPKPIGNYGQGYPSSTPKPIGSYGQDYPSNAPKENQSDDGYGSSDDGSYPDSGVYKVDSPSGQDGHYENGPQQGSYNSGLPDNASAKDPGYGNARLPTPYDPSNAYKGDIGDYGSPVSQGGDSYSYPRGYGVKSAGASYAYGTPTFGVSYSLSPPRITYPQYQPPQQPYNPPSIQKVSYGNAGIAPYQYPEGQVPGIPHSTYPTTTVRTPVPTLETYQPPKEEYDDPERYPSGGGPPDSYSIPDRPQYNPERTKGSENHGDSDKEEEPNLPNYGIGYVTTTEPPHQEPEKNDYGVLVTNIGAAPPREEYQPTPKPDEPTRYTPYKIVDNLFKYVTDIVQGPPEPPKPTYDEPSPTYTPPQPTYTPRPPYTPPQPTYTPRPSYTPSQPTYTPRPTYSNAQSPIPQQEPYQPDVPKTVYPVTTPAYGGGKQSTSAVQIEFGGAYDPNGRRPTGYSDNGKSSGGFRTEYIISHSYGPAPNNGKQLPYSSGKPLQVPTTVAPPTFSYRPTISGSYNSGSPYSSPGPIKVPSTYSPSTYSPSTPAPRPYTSPTPYSSPLTTPKTSYVSPQNNYDPQVKGDDGDGGRWGYHLTSSATGTKINGYNGGQAYVSHVYPGPVNHKSYQDDRSSRRYNFPGGNNGNSAIYGYGYPSSVGQAPRNSKTVPKYGTGQIFHGYRYASASVPHDNSSQYGRVQYNTGIGHGEDGGGYQGQFSQYGQNNDGPQGYEIGKDSYHYVGRDYEIGVTKDDGSSQRSGGNQGYSGGSYQNQGTSSKAGYDNGNQQKDSKGYKSGIETGFRHVIVDGGSRDSSYNSHNDYKASGKTTGNVGSGGYTSEIGRGGYAANSGYRAGSDINNHRDYTSTPGLGYTGYQSGQSGDGRQSNGNNYQNKQGNRNDNRDEVKTGFSHVIVDSGAINNQQNRYNTGNRPYVSTENTDSGYKPDTRQYNSGKDKSQTYSGSSAYGGAAHGAVRNGEEYKSTSGSAYGGASQGSSRTGGEYRVSVAPDYRTGGQYKASSGGSAYGSDAHGDARTGGEYRETSGGSAYGSGGYKVSVGPDNRNGGGYQATGGSAYSSGSHDAARTGGQYQAAGGSTYGSSHGVAKSGGQYQAAGGSTYGSSQGATKSGGDHQVSVGPDYRTGGGYQTTGGSAYGSSSRDAARTGGQYQAAGGSTYGSSQGAAKSGEDHQVSVGPDYRTGGGYQATGGSAFGSSHGVAKSGGQYQAAGGSTYGSSQGAAKSGGDHQVSVGPDYRTGGGYQAAGGSTYGSSQGAAKSGGEYEAKSSSDYRGAAQGASRTGGQYQATGGSAYSGASQGSGKTGGEYRVSVGPDNRNSGGYQSQGGSHLRAGGNYQGSGGSTSKTGGEYQAAAGSAYGGGSAARTGGEHQAKGGSDGQYQSTERSNKDSAGVVYVTAFQGAGGAGNGYKNGGSNLKSGSGYPSRSQGQSGYNGDTKSSGRHTGASSSDARNVGNYNKKNEDSGGDHRAGPNVQPTRGKSNTGNSYSRPSGNYGTHQDDGDFRISNVTYGAAGSIQCDRAGLFRHPEDCNQFYECYWDRWIQKFTLHFFHCPVRLVYDNRITGCNWPLYGPSCRKK